MDGSKYEGEFMNNDLDGSGTYSWGDGRCYKGGWTANKMNRQHLYYMHWMGIFFYI